MANKVYIPVGKIMLIILLCASFTFATSLPFFSYAETNSDMNSNCPLQTSSAIIKKEKPTDFGISITRVQGTGGKWVYQGKTSKKVSWKKGTAVSSVALAIATVAPFAGPTGIIAAIGLGTLANIANNSIGGTLTYKMYLYDYLGVQKVKYIWTFKTSSGETYGPYTTIVNTN